MLLNVVVIDVCVMFFFFIFSIFIEVLLPELLSSCCNAAMLNMAYDVGLKKMKKR